MRAIVPLAATTISLNSLALIKKTWRGTWPMPDSGQTVVTNTIQLFALSAATGSLDALERMRQRRIWLSQEVIRFALAHWVKCGQRELGSDSNALVSRQCERSAVTHWCLCVLRTSLKIFWMTATMQAMRLP